MRKAILIGPAAILLFAVYPAAAQNTQSPPAQNPPAQSQSAPSLADAARKAREAKKSEPKSAKSIFTNDNLPTSGDVNVVGEGAANPAAAAPSTSTKQSLDQQEQYWRSRFSAARNQLSRDQATLDVLQREMDRLQLQYYPNDPQKQLIQSVTRSDIINQQSKIDKKKADIAADKQALADLDDALRHAGGDPGWAR
jgi:chromosome segregation ATPase